MHKRTALRGLAADPIKIGLILPMTGQQATTGRQIDAAVKLYLAQNGNTIAGRKVEVIVKDDATVPDTTRRLAQELVVQEKVVALAGFGITPAAMATAPIATQSKTPMVVMAAATSAITNASPFVVRSSFTLPQASVAIAEWANKNNIKKVVTLVSDYAPGIDAEKFFADRIVLNGGSVMDKLRTPLRSPDFAPVLQKVRDAKPDALFVFLPSGQGAAFMKQFAERGLDKAGIRLIGTGDITDDDSSTTWATWRWAWSPRTTIRRTTSRPRTRSSSRPSRRPTTACGPTSWRWAATTACASSWRRSRSPRARAARRCSTP